MKKYLLFFLAISFIANVYGQEADNNELKQKKAYLRFEPTEIDLGIIAVDDINDDFGDITINVINDGAEPLIINNVTGCCGTKVDDWPKKPIAQGQKGEVKVSFRIAPRPQRISRTVTIYSNAENGNSLRIAIKGEVVLKKEENEINLP